MFVPYHLTILPVLSRSGLARVRNHRYSSRSAQNTTHARRRLGDAAPPRRCCAPSGKLAKVGIDRYPVRDRSAISTSRWQECYRIWGFDPVEGLPNRETVWRRIHPGDRDRMYKETQEALRQKRDYKVDFRIVLPDGTVKYLEAIGKSRGLYAYSPTGFC
jgi:hypothetical protein